MNSHHDLLVSTWSLPRQEPVLDESSTNIVAPTVRNSRAKVIWTDEGIEEFQKFVSSHLSRIQQLWLNNPTGTSISLLLQSSSNVLTSFANSINKSIPLDGSRKLRDSSIPKPQNALKKLNKQVREAEVNVTLSNSELLALKRSYKKARLAHRKLERNFKAKASFDRDKNLSMGPSFVYKSIKAAKRCQVRKIQKLLVGNKCYHGDSVKDGFFDSISTLKTRDSSHLVLCPTFHDFSKDCGNILEICKRGDPIPPISERRSFEILQKMKPDVTDIYGITVNHYNYAGPAGWKHFYLLLKCLISNINSTNIEEINTVYACIFFKGYGKDGSSHKSTGLSLLVLLLLKHSIFMLKT